MLDTLNKENMVALLKTAGKAALTAALAVVFAYFGVRQVPVEVKADVPQVGPVAVTATVK